MAIARQDSQRDFADTLAKMAPDFYYTRGLYLDFDGAMPWVTQMWSYPVIGPRFDNG